MALTSGCRRRPHARSGLIGRHPGPDLTPHALAALLDSSLAEAQRMLDVLAGAHLIEPSRAGHYRPHALLRVYAGELAGADPSSRR